MTPVTILSKTPTGATEGVQGADITLASDKTQSQNSGSTIPAFPAIFFGVIFAIPCVIFGAKYCFRNAPNRTRATIENERPTPLATIPDPRRGRRQKTLMTANELMDRFPERQYATWVSERAGACRPTTGSFSVTIYGHNSIHKANTLAKAGHLTNETCPSSVPGSTTVAATEQEEHQVGARYMVESEPLEAEHHAEARRTTSPCPPRLPLGRGFGNNWHPGTVVLPGRTSVSGDICAICIDLFENEDYIRELMCGHVFHVACVDTWLTSHRGCCPLCKAELNMPMSGYAEGCSSVASDNPNLGEHDWISYPSHPRPACIRDGNLTSLREASLL